MIPVVMNPSTISLDFVDVGEIDRRDAKFLAIDDQPDADWKDQLLVYPKGLLPLPNALAEIGILGLELAQRFGHFLSVIRGSSCRHRL